MADGFVGGPAYGTMCSQVYLLIGMFDISLSLSLPPLGVRCLKSALTRLQLSDDKHPLLSDSAILDGRNRRVGISGSHVSPVPSNLAEIESRIASTTVQLSNI